MDYFYSVNEYTCFTTKIKRSTFIGHLAYVESIEEAKEFISKINSEHKTATHNCWAYVVGDQGQTFHSSDSGEPSGTAGKPMLNALQKNRLTNIAAVVTRYYGGVKLGVRGLIDAYGGTLEETVNVASLKKLVEYDIFRVQLSYDFFETFKYNVTKMGAELGDIQYSDVIQLELSQEKPLAEELNLYLESLSQAGKISVNNIKQ